MLTKQQQANIKKKLFLQKTTITALASELGFSRQYVSNVINGTRNDVEIEKALLNWKNRG